MTNEDLQQMARELDARGEAYAVVTVVRAVAPTSAYPGAQAIILADGRLHGWIGGGCARDLVIGAAKCAIEKGEPKLVRISNEQIYAGEDVEHYAMSCASNGSVELFIQPNNLGNALCVLGCTPAADEARFLAERLRIRLTDSPDDAPVVLVATQGQGDEEALEAALRSPAKHVLMIASRRKSDRLRTLMKMRGVDESQLARLQAPAGPDAGAKTPGEIALVAIAGVLASLRDRVPGLPQAEPVERKAAERAGQDGSRSISHTAPASASAEVKFINPVCGMAVSTANALHVEEYAGVSYYFCCDGCWTMFLKDPGKYAAIHQISIGAVPAGQPPHASD
ncbi:MAG: XdhC family protein [Steroidobacteraceae bacterium]